jgi:hypothetical protein
MGFGLRIAPGVRVSASGRGLRAGIGPRAARIHVGGGRPGVSTGAGPLTLFGPVRGTQRRSPSVSSYERQVRAAERQQQLEAVAAVDQALVHLCRAHLEDFPEAEHPAAPAPESVDPKAIQKVLRDEATEGISALSFGKRRQAKQQADAKVDAAIAKEEKRRAMEQIDTQKKLDEVWEKLRANDAGTILAVLEVAFEDNEAPAAAVHADRDQVQVLVRWPQLDSVVGERKLATTPTGRPTNHKRSKSERNRLYIEALASNALATTKEAFAMCPAVNSVALMVIRGQDDPATGHTQLQVLFNGVIERDWLKKLNWKRIEAGAALESVPGGELRLGGRTRELQPLALDTKVEKSLSGLAEQLGWHL